VRSRVLRVKTRSFVHGRDAPTIGVDLGPMARLSLHPNPQAGVQGASPLPPLFPLSRTGRGGREERVACATQAPGRWPSVRRHQAYGSMSGWRPGNALGFRVLRVKTRSFTVRRDLTSRLANRPEAIADVHPKPDAGVQGAKPLAGGERGVSPLSRRFPLSPSGRGGQGERVDCAPPAPGSHGQVARVDTYIFRNQARLAL